MGTSGNKQAIKIGTLAERITNFYLFQKQIEKVFNYKKSQKYNYNNIPHQYKKYYILDYDWIRNWMVNSGYSSLKDQMESIYNSEDQNKITSLKTLCQIKANQNQLNNYEPQFSNDTIAYSLLLSNNSLAVEDFDCLVNEETYKLFKSMSFLNRFKKSITIDGIITNRMIILFFNNNQCVKFIYKGMIEGKEELIQLTANCLELNGQTDEFDLKQSELKYLAFTNYLKNSTDNQIIDKFDELLIGFTQEIKLNISSFTINITNEKLFEKYSNKFSLPPEIINFKNVNNFRLIGLENVGATCYMNATLQCFINIGSITKYLLTKEIYEKIESNSSSFGLSRAYCHLLNKVCLGDNVDGCYAPREFKEVISNMNPLFKGINANDSKDLINFLLEVLNHETYFRANNMIVDQTNLLIILENFRKTFSINNNSIISRNFFFIMQTNTICSGCNRIKYNFQALFLLEFPLELVYKYCSDNNLPSLNTQGNKKKVNLIHCFEHYNQPSNFVGENQLYCNDCKALKDAKNYNILFSLPPVLVIILNRGKGKSFDCDVDFPQFLNLQNYINYRKSLCEYQLRGVICHLGESGMSGHFIAYCRHRIRNRWYCYNDATVSPCQNQENGFKNGTPYILFYESNNNNNVLFDQNIEPIYIKNYMNNLNSNSMSFQNHLNMNNINFSNNMNNSNFNNNMSNRNIDSMSMNNMNNNMNMNNMSDNMNMNNINNMNINNMNNNMNMNNINNMNINNINNNNNNFFPNNNNINDNMMNNNNNFNNFN